MSSLPTPTGLLVKGTNGNDNLLGGAQNDTITAFNGNDTAAAGSGNDYVDGGSGNDSLSGEAGNDTLLGALGNDTLNGGEGNDTLDGGTGADGYLFTMPTDGIDRVNTFTSGLDSILVDGTNFPGLNAGTLAVSQFIVGTVFTSPSQRFRFEPFKSGPGGNAAKLFYDPDGNGAAPSQQLLEMPFGGTIAAGDIKIVNVPETDFTLELLHAGDWEGGLPALGSGTGGDFGDAQRFSQVLNALRADPRFNNTVTVLSGDNYIPGPFLAASADSSVETLFGATGNVPGRGDIALMNEMGVQLTVFGNHEFDQGTRAISDQISAAAGFAGLNAPYLSANLNFAPNSDLSDNDALLGDGVDVTNLGSIPNGAISKSAFITVAGEKIGFVGATTPALRSLSSIGTVQVLPGDAAEQALTPAELDALAAEIQDDINALVATGIDKVVVLSHLQLLENELALASRLRHVDIIVAGGNHRISLDENDRLRAGDAEDVSYPAVFGTDADGKPIAVVNAASNYKYVGRFVIGFDANGNIIPSTYDYLVSGAYPTDMLGVAEVNDTLTGATTLAGQAIVDPEVAAITNAMRTVVQVKDGNVLGFTDVYLDGRRSEVRSQETSFGNLNADASLAYARSFSDPGEGIVNPDPTALLSLKNGGGIRDSIGQIAGGQGGSTVTYEPPPANPNSTPPKPDGGVSQLDIENSLRFNNALSLLTLEAIELKDMFEFAVSGSPLGQGRFPQISGVAFSFDLAQTGRTTLGTGTRVRSLAILDDLGNVVDVVVQGGTLQGNASRTLRMTTTSFLAGGGDSYPFPSYDAGLPLNKVDLDTLPSAGFAEDGREQDAFADYMAANFPTPGTAFTSEVQSNGADLAPAQDTRVQNLAQRSDTVLNADPATRSTADFTIPGNDNILGDANANVLVGYAGNDTINGGAGNDIIAGSRGKDSLSGGADNDVFVYAAMADLVSGAANADVIADFTDGADTLRVADAIATSFGSGSGQLNAAASGADTVVYREDGTAGFGGTEMVLAVLTGFTAANFTAADVDFATI